MSSQLDFECHVCGCPLDVTYEQDKAYSTWVARVSVCGDCKHAAYEAGYDEAEAKYCKEDDE